MKFPAPPHIEALHPYIPGKPIEETQREYGLKKVVKLASNENPLGPSPKAIQAIQSHLTELHRYPDSGRRLKDILAERLSVTPSEIVLGNGSNEVIDMVIRTYGVDGEGLVTSQAAFICYRVGAQIHGLQTLEAPLTPDRRFDVKGLFHLLEQNENAKFVFIANPNNPTGTYIREDELRWFLEKVNELNRSVLVVLDYAYWEYVNAKDLPDPMPFYREFPNVMVTRTFSKAYGLAGIRIGYGLARPEIISYIERIREPFNCNPLAFAAAEAALSDEDFLSESLEVNRIGMEYWETELKRLGVPYWPSQGNFLMADSKAGWGKTGPDSYLDCLKRGLIVRPIKGFGLENELRISIGTPEENEFAIEVLTSVIEEARGK